MIRYIIHRTRILAGSALLCTAALVTGCVDSSKAADADVPAEEIPQTYPQIGEGVGTAVSFEFQGQTLEWSDSPAPEHWADEESPNVAFYVESGDSDIRLTFYEAWTETGGWTEAIFVANTPGARTVALDLYHNDIGYHSQTTANCPEGNLTASIVGNNELHVWGEWTGMVCAPEGVALPTSGVFTSLQPVPLFN